MDIIIVAIISIFLIKGVKSGVFNTFLSTLCFFAAAIAAYFARGFGAEILKNVGFLNNFAFTTLPNAISSFLPGTFESVEQLSTLLSQKSAILSQFFSKILQKINFDPSLSSGQILGQTVGELFFEALSFILIFVMVFFLLSIIKIPLKKLADNCGFCYVDKVLGGLVGVAKGATIVVFCVSITILLANLTLNENVLNFVTGGKIANWLCENIIKKIIEIS